MGTSTSVLGTLKAARFSRANSNIEEDREGRICQEIVELANTLEAVSDVRTIFRNTKESYRRALGNEFRICPKLREIVNAAVCQALS